MTHTLTVSIIDGHDLVFKVHKNDLLRVVFNAQLALRLVHDVVHAVQLSRADLLALEVYLDTKG